MDFSILNRAIKIAGSMASQPPAPEPQTGGAAPPQQEEPITLRSNPLKARAAFHRPPADHWLTAALGLTGKGPQPQPTMPQFPGHAPELPPIDTSQMGAALGGDDGYSAALFSAPNVIGPSNIDATPMQFARRAAAAAGFVPITLAELPETEDPVSMMRLARQELLRGY